MNGMVRAVARRKDAADELLRVAQAGAIKDQHFSIGRGLRQVILPDPPGSDWSELLDRFGDR